MLAAALDPPLNTLDQRYDSKFSLPQITRHLNRLRKNILERQTTFIAEAVYLANGGRLTYLYVHLSTHHNTRILRVDDKYTYV